MFTTLKTHRVMTIAVILAMVFSGIQPTTVLAQKENGVKGLVNAQGGGDSSISPENRRVDSALSGENIPALVGGTWYVATTGNNSNSCSAAASPCLTIDGAIAKAGNNDTIKVASGTYTNTTGNVVTISKGLTLSGGWNDTFTLQNGASVIDGGGVRNGILASATGAVVVERFVVQNSFTGADSGGIYVYGGSFTLKNSSVINNYGGQGAGIFTINNATLTILNSTISNNMATSSGGGIYAADGTVTINNSTIAYNTSNGVGGGFTSGSAVFSVKNTILAKNTATSSGQDCSGSIGSSDHNIIGNTSGCTVTTGAGDQFNVDPLIDSSLTGTLPLHSLQGTSPAIDAGDNGTCLSTDQRGMPRPRGVACDIGAYEYTTEGGLMVVSGSGQIANTGASFGMPFTVHLFDSSMNPVSGVTITFTAPFSGASGTFANTGTIVTTAITNSNGVATSSIFTANNTAGSYTITATEPGYSATANFSLTNDGGLFVATTGNDSNNCATPSTPCATINAAINKADDGDIIKVAGGRYTSTTGNEVAYINKSISLSGGWNASFTNQNQTSVIDGQGARTGIFVSFNANNAIIDKFKVQNGIGMNNWGGGGISIFNGSVIIRNSTITQNKDSGISNSNGTVIIENSIISWNIADWGGGINNYGPMTLNNTIVSNNKGGVLNYSNGFGAGITSGADITLNSSAVINNTLVSVWYEGSGIAIREGTATINNSTISGNTGGDGSGLLVYGSALVTINNSAISNNERFGIHSKISGRVNIQNTIVAKNGITSDCYGNSDVSIISLGYNLIGNATNCGITPASGDKMGTLNNPIDPKLGPLVTQLGVQTLLPGSPAIDSANQSTCLPADQRGVTRPYGAGCDIGAYEYTGGAGLAVFYGVASGSNQSSYVGNTFSEPMAVYVVDGLGNPISGIKVTFSIPMTGPSIVFANSGSKTLDKGMEQSDFAKYSNGPFTDKAIYEITVMTINGVATAPPFKSNFQEGSYMVIATILEPSATVTFSLTNIPISTQPNLLQNGNFEDPIPGNYWDAHSSNYGTPLCTYAICGYGGGTAGPHSGNTWVWFGGARYSEYGFIVQPEVIIPPGPARLRFYLWIGYAEPGSTSEDKLTVTLRSKYSNDDIVIFTANATQQILYPNYKLVEIDLRPYIDENPHSIKFSSQTNGKIVNFNLDDISINAATFGDVPPDYWSWNWIERLYNNNITGGCSTSPLTYCPENQVTRAQMAVFLLKGIHNSSYSPPSVGTGTGFSDVPLGYWADKWIKQLALEGITGG